jgi:hypothetical protein
MPSRIADVAPSPFNQNLTNNHNWILRECFFLQYGSAIIDRRTLEEKEKDLQKLKLKHGRGKAKRPPKTKAARQFSSRKIGHGGDPGRQQLMMDSTVLMSSESATLRYCYNESRATEGVLYIVVVAGEDILGIFTSQQAEEPADNCQVKETVKHCW